MSHFVGRKITKTVVTTVNLSVIIEVAGQKARQLYSCDHSLGTCYEKVLAVHNVNGPICIFFKESDF